MTLKAHIKIMSLLSLALVLIGASKCDKNPLPPIDPTPPEISGEWKWDCSELAAPPLIEHKTTVEPLALTCSQQVPLKTPFMEYVIEHIGFAPDTTTWIATFSFGTCVDQQVGTYKYAYNTTSKLNELEVFDSQGTLQQKYSVTKVSDTELNLLNEEKSCNLTRSQLPIALKGNHPRPQITIIEWDFDIDSSVAFYSSNAQFPFVYQSPQLQSRGTPFGSYRADATVLNILSDGSELSHYAAFITLYDNVTNTLLATSDVHILDPGVIFKIEYTDPRNGSHIKTQAQYRY